MGSSGLKVQCSGALGAELCQTEEARLQIAQLGHRSPTGIAGVGLA